MRRVYPQVAELLKTPLGTVKTRMRDRVLAAVVTRHKARRSHRSRWVAAAAAVVAAAGTGTAVFVVQQQRVRDERTVAETARDQEAEVRGVLRDQVLADGGKVTVAYSRLRDSGVVMMSADAAPTGGRVFQPA